LRLINHYALPLLTATIAESQEKEKRSNFLWAANLWALLMAGSKTNKIVFSWI
jgi:hypothetical protein